MIPVQPPAPPPSPDLGVPFSLSPHPAALRRRLRRVQRRQPPPPVPLQPPPRLPPNQIVVRQASLETELFTSESERESSTLRESSTPSAFKTKEAQTDGEVEPLPSASSPLSTEIVATADNNRPTGQLALPSSSSMTTSLATTSNNQYTIPLDENEHRYVGLVNQAMTCYLNSLVQTLYMTPEFRNAMYEWEYQSAQAKEQKKKAEQSIPCQLQKLFLLLQTTENDSLETKDLTQSFGWTSNEAYDQHDVQELCRLMFDALEHKWKGTKHEKLIQDLYRGTMEDFVACLKCGRESIKTDYFLDLPLAVKPFGAMHAYRSVEEALDAFIQPELLEGSNQYMCETYVLDLNEYVNKKDAAGKPIDQQKNEDDDMDLGSPNPKRYTPSTKSPNRYGSATGTTTTGGDEVCVGQPIDHDVVEALRKSHGDNVYELFSVMVHSGNAAGGHYFAYIKNMDQDKWYVFNDTRVDHASPGDIEKSFGGHTSGWNQSNTNAYMLMYRKIDRKRNASFILSNKLPQHIKDSQEKWKRLEMEAKERLRKLSLIQVHVTINYPFPSVAFLPDRTEYDLTSKKHQIAEDFSEYKTEISREQPIRAIFNQAFDFFLERAQNFNLPFVKGSARLIYVEHGKLLGVFHSPNELDKKLRVVFNHHKGEPRSMFSVHFMLDVRLASTFFPLEIQNQMTIRIQRVDVGKRTTANELTIAVRGYETILGVKQWIGSQFRDDYPAVLNSRVILETASSSREFVMIDTSYHTMNFRNVMTQFVGYSTPTVS
uniref:Ubiquitin carboxyl-terminal hydrolase n=1 Tax=Caenorhabditis tropicalis TaxID=1561998 RepID=A0A1I7TNX9_9PELO